MKRRLFQKQAALLSMKPNIRLRKVNASISRVSIVIVCCFVSLYAFSQTNSMIIDPSASDNYVYDLGNDTLASFGPQFGNGSGSSPSYHDVYYDLDIDLNGIPDLQFTAYAYWGGLGSNSYITLKSSDGTYFAVANTEQVLGHMEPNVGPVYEIDTVPLVRPYNLSDTIYNSDCSETATHFISRYSRGQQYSIVYYDFDTWISGEHYIGFKKLIGSTEYCGWLKVEVPDEYHIIFKELALNSNALMESGSIPEISLYPNPANNMITLDFESIGEAVLEIVKPDGSVVIRQAFSAYNEQLDVSSLLNGTYYIRLTGASWTKVLPLIKH